MKKLFKVPDWAVRVMRRFHEHWSDATINCRDSYKSPGILYVEIRVPRFGGYKENVLPMLKSLGSLDWTLSSDYKNGLTLNVWRSADRKREDKARARS